MATIALVVSIVALLVAIGSAGYTRRQATAAEGSLTIERERRLEERRPRLTGMFFVSGVNAKQYGLRITLDSDEPLAGLDVTISEEGQGIEFNPRTYGVVSPHPNELALRAFSHDIIGGPAGLKPHSSVTWAASVPEKHPEHVRLDVACHGAGGERWDVVVDADVEPRIANTVR
jgi:hypothetical protein